MQLFKRRFIGLLLVLGVISGAAVPSTYATTSSWFPPFPFESAPAIPDGRSWCDVYPFTFQENAVAGMWPISRVQDWYADSAMLRANYPQNIVHLRFDSTNDAVDTYRLLTWQPEQDSYLTVENSFTVGGTLDAGFSEAPQQDYITPWNPANGMLEIEDYVTASGRALRSTFIDSLITTKHLLIVPLNDGADGSGINKAYHVAQFARVRILELDRYGRWIDVIVLEPQLNDYACFQSSSRDTLGQTSHVQAFTPMQDGVDAGLWPNQFYTYDWSWGDSTTSTTHLSATEHLYGAPGIYNVTLIATLYTTNGVALSAQHFVASYGQIVVESPIAMALSGNPNQVGQPSQLRITLSQPQTSWMQRRALSVTLDWGDGSPSATSITSVASSTTITPTHSYGQPGSYQVVAQLTDNNGAVTSQTHTIQVDALPTASFTSSDPRYSQRMFYVDFTSHVQGSGPLSYQWNFGDGQTSTAANPTHAYSMPNQYVVTLTVTDRYGSSVITQGTVKIGNLTPAPTPGPIDM